MSVVHSKISYEFSEFFSLFSDYFFSSVTESAFMKLLLREGVYMYMKQLDEYIIQLIFT